jgi:hypothetical protein
VIPHGGGMKKTAELVKYLIEWNFQASVDGGPATQQCLKEQHFRNESGRAVEVALRSNQEKLIDHLILAAGNSWLWLLHLSQCERMIVRVSLKEVKKRMF